MMAPPRRRPPVRRHARRTPETATYLPEEDWPARLVRQRRQQPDGDPRKQRVRPRDDRFLARDPRLAHRAPSAGTRRQTVDDQLLHGDPRGGERGNTVLRFLHRNHLGQRDPVKRALAGIAKEGLQGQASALDLADGEVTAVRPVASGEALGQVAMLRLHLFEDVRDPSERGRHAQQPECMPGRRCVHDDLRILP